MRFPCPNTRSLIKVDTQWTRLAHSPAVRLYSPKGEGQRGRTAGRNASSPSHQRNASANSWHNVQPSLDPSHRMGSGGAHPQRSNAFSPKMMSPETLPDRYSHGPQPAEFIWEGWNPLAGPPSPRPVSTGSTSGGSLGWNQSRQSKPNWFGRRVAHSLQLNRRKRTHIHLGIKF